LYIVYTTPLADIWNISFPKSHALVTEKYKLK
jgi:hypothetical protein